MRVLLLVMLCVMVLMGGVGYAQAAGSEYVAAYEIDARATAQAPWKVGEVVVAECMSRFEPVMIERRFVGITSDGKFVVQDFYQSSGQKLTDSFVMVEREFVDILDWDHYESRHLVPIEGVLITWYENGEKKCEGQYVDREPQGVWVCWYETGRKLIEGAYENGEKRGVWIRWNRDGSKAEEEVFE